MIEEQNRLIESEERRAYWRRWGPYLSERQWGTVREDYSPHGTAWDYFPHDHARSRAYRWGEDGLCGISDNHQRLCFALAVWNGRDPILKERLFGLGNPEGNHGEDVKEYYFYLDSTPTHSYMKCLYKYPQAAFPYRRLVEENRRRGRGQPEYELLETGAFDDDRYFDITGEYAKGGVDDLLIRITAANRGPEAAELHLLPTLWFRNTWSWDVGAARPQLQATASTRGQAVIAARQQTLGARWLHAEGAPELLFTENETNFARLFGVPARSTYVKDSIGERVVAGKEDAVNPARVGTKAAAWYRASVPAGGQITLRLRLTAADPDRAGAAFGLDFEEIFSRRIREADDFYDLVIPRTLSADGHLVMRQALAGMLWSRQFYHYDVKRWLAGDPTQPPPPPERRKGRNHEWTHLYNEDVISMPDTWEYPWYAAWDLAFHMIPLALVDPEFAKAQIVLFLREWYMHPNGQLPAYEWALGDVNPPVHAWAAWRVYKIDRRIRGVADRQFLEKVFHKHLLNFTWWVNRKDSESKNVFQGGFLGLDNIGVFDRSAPLPTGGYIEQSDGTSWMGMFSLNMMTIALELALNNPVYENIALKFFEHFLAIAAAMNNIGDEGIRLWDEEDEFFYDVLHLPNETYHPIKLRSLVGLIPLCAVEVLEPHVLDALPTFKYNLTWFLNYRPDLMRLVSHWQQPEAGERRLLALVRGHRMKRLLKRMLDSTEFLSEYGIRSLSKHHAAHPYILPVNGVTYSVQYDPAESRSELFGGNSNWRGPIWFPLNYLLIESLHKFYYYYGDDFKVECPTGSGQYFNLKEVAGELSQRLMRLFLCDKNGRRPFNGDDELLQRDPQWRDYLLFHEFFHGDKGTGLGASHQTGWTGLVAILLQQSGIQGEDDPMGISSVGHRQTVPLGFEPLERS